MKTQNVPTKSEKFPKFCQKSAQDLFWHPFLARRSEGWFMSKDPVARPSKKISEIRDESGKTHQQFF